MIALIYIIYKTRVSLFRLKFTLIQLVNLFVFIHSEFIRSEFILEFHLLKNNSKNHIFFAVQLVTTVTFVVI